MLINVCYIIIYFFEACIFWQYCRNLFSSKLTRWGEAFALFLGYLILYASFFLPNGGFWINFFMFLLVHFVYLRLAYNLKLTTAFFHSLFVTMVMVLTELLTESIIFYFITDSYNERPYFRNMVIGAVISKVFYFLILQYTSFYMKRRMAEEPVLQQSTLFLSVISLMSGFITLVFCAICINTKLSLFLDILITISAVFILAINIFLAWFYTSIQEKNQKYLEMQLLLQKEYDTAVYFDALHQQDENQKILLHDVRKHLLSIADLNEKGDAEKIDVYIRQIIQSSDLQDSVQVCDNNLLNTIIFHARQQCKESGASFHTDIRSGCIDFLSEYDMTALFSNLLDNAVEAAENTPDPYIELSITPRDSKSILITMVNSCGKNPFSRDGRRFITMKKDKRRHGFGMKSIQRVVKKYEGDSQFYFDAEDDTFHTILILQKIPLDVDA